MSDDAPNREPQVERRNERRSQRRSDQREDERDIRYEGAEDVRDVKYEGREEVRDTRYSIRETVRDEIQTSYRRFLRKAVPAFVCTGVIVAVISAVALYDSQRIGDNQASAKQTCEAMNVLRAQSNDSRDVLKASLRVLITHLQQDVEGQIKPAVIQRLNNIADLENQIQNVTLTPPIDCVKLYGQ